MEKDFQNKAYDKNVLEFLAISSEYCNFMDNLQDFSRNEFIDRSLKILPLLYLKASLLPSVKFSDVIEVEKVVTQEEWQYVHNKISFLMDDLNTYNELLDPLNKDNIEPFLATLSENFADIYQDMKDFVSLYQMGIPEIVDDAIAECKNNFKDYWGQSLVNALHALHKLRYKPQ